MDDYFNSTVTARCESCGCGFERKQVEDWRSMCVDCWLERKATTAEVRGAERGPGPARRGPTSSARLEIVTSDDIEPLQHVVEDLVTELRRLWHDVRRLENRVRQLEGCEDDDPRASS